MTTDLPPVSAPAEVVEELERRARDLGWDEGLVRRALGLRVGPANVAFWQDQERLTNDRVLQQLDAIERLRSGTLMAREAMPDDDEALAELYANAPERFGDWEITTERRPNPFAQFRLQERVTLRVLEDRGAILAASAESRRNTIVGGRKISAMVQTAFRVRNEVRGKGLSHLLRMSDGPALSWYPMVSYSYIRPENQGAFEWFRAVGAAAGGPGETGDMPRLSHEATVYHLTPFESDTDPAIRPARPSDLERCVELVNRTHAGLDLFRPYTVDFLRERLEGPVAALEPESFSPVYGREDFFVLEDTGEILACGGLWDRGRHVREVWRRVETGEERTIASTALMDFGVAGRSEDALARLISDLASKTAEKGRDSLIAPLEHLPDVLERLAALEPAPEKRAMRVHFEEGVPELAELSIDKPYTDLAYW